MDQPSATSTLDGASIVERLGALISQARFQEASDLLLKMPASLAGDINLICLNALVEFELGHYLTAEKLAREALAAQPDIPAMHLVLGQALASLGQHEDAAAALLAAHRRGHGDYKMAILLLAQAVAAYGIEGAQPIYDELSVRQDWNLRALWAKLVFRSEGIDALPSGFGVAQVMSVRDWLAGHGGWPEFEGEREIIPIETPPVFGASHDPDTYMDVEGYVPYVASVPDATIFAGSSLVFAPDGPALNDTFVDSRYGRFLDLRLDPVVLDRNRTQVLVDVNAVSVMQLDAAIMLSGWASKDFGHWVPEFLCRLVYLEQHPRFSELPIVVDAGMPYQHIEYLRLLVSNPIIELPAKQALRCGELVVGSPYSFFHAHATLDHTMPPEHQNCFSLGGLQYLQARIAERLPPPPASAPRRKLYISRQKRKWRLTDNEAQVAAAMVKRGFEVVFPENMNFEEQVRMFQSASMVVAPGGSALLNAIFAPTDVKMLILAQQNLFNWCTFYGPMRKLGFDFTMFCGEATGDPEQKHANYRVPVEGLMAAIDSLEA